MSESLDLTKVFDRDTVTLPGGREYEIKNPEEFSVLEEFRLNALIKRIDAARQKAGDKDATEEDAQQASALLAELATLLIIDLNEEVGDWASVAVFDFWIRKQIAIAEARAAEEGVKRPPQKARSARKKSSTTARSRRASKSSSAARRRTG